MKKLLFLFISVISVNNYLIGQIPYPGESPGQAVIKTLRGNLVALENKVIRMEFINDGKKINIRDFKDKKTNEQLNPATAALFELTLPDSSVITSNEFTLVKSPVASTIMAAPHATIYAHRFGGKKYEADFENQKLGINVHWEADLRDDDNYVRQLFIFTTNDTANISKITLLKFPDNIGVRKEGKVDGSPMVHKNMFFAIEHPMSQVEQSNASMVSYLLQFSPFTSAKSFTTSTVWGTTPVGQLRRGFLYYLERERSHLYRQMLHYNSFYNISKRDGKFTESQILDRIKMFKDSLIVQRNVKLDAFLLDDGWDDNQTLWKINTTGFPNGFTRLKNALDSCASSIGVWLSPFGGYGDDKNQRIKYGKSQNPPFETNTNGLSLAGQVYYNRFLNVTSDLIKDYNISMFKFDGVGAGNDAKGAGVSYHNDIEAFLKLLKDIKEIKPDLYLSLTTGTWPSAYWLMYGDNIWRSGLDKGQTGEGSKRQRGITYRDANTYKHIVTAAPLYPLSALMNGGIIVCDNGLPGQFEMDDKNISDDIWSFFGTGVNLQELYINPHKLNTANWNCLAKASKWARANERIMPDVHWVGGDPAKGEVYGYAAWSPEKAVLFLRNPSKEQKSFQFNVADVFELPAYVKNDYQFWDAKTDSRVPLVQGGSCRITLQPFEVQVFDALSHKL